MQLRGSAAERIYKSRRTLSFGIRAHERFVSLLTIWQTLTANDLNRPVRTRRRDGVGRAISDEGPYPIRPVSGNRSAANKLDLNAVTSAAAPQWDFAAKTTTFPSMHRSTQSFDSFS